MNDLLRKYARALMKGADSAASGPRVRGKGLRDEFFLRVAREHFDTRSSVLLIIDVHRAVPGLVREEMRNRLIALRDDLDTMIDALAKVRE